MEIPLEKEDPRDVKFNKQTNTWKINDFED